jgi:hypothetical protein
MAKLGERSEANRRGGGRKRSGDKRSGEAVKMGR